MELNAKAALPYAFAAEQAFQRCSAYEARKAKANANNPDAWVHHIGIISRPNGQQRQSS